MAEGFGPGAVAVAVVGVADEGEFAGGGKLLFEAAEVSAEPSELDKTILAGPVSTVDMGTLKVIS